VAGAADAQSEEAAFWRENGRGECGRDSGPGFGSNKAKLKAEIGKAESILPGGFGSKQSRPPMRTDAHRILHPGFASKGRQGRTWTGKKIAARS